MPTPSEALPVEAEAVMAAESPPPAHTTCPPESDRDRDRVVGWRLSSSSETHVIDGEESNRAGAAVVAEPKAQDEECAVGNSTGEGRERETMTTGPDTTTTTASTSTPAAAAQSSKEQTEREDTPSSQFTSDTDATATKEVKPASPTPTPTAAPIDTSSSPTPVSEVIDYKPDALPNYEFSNERLLPSHTSSFLRAGSKFTGTQQSDRQIYNVDVEIKHVDMAESYLCGYLRIQGLTEDHPTLTTYFEGEIIGSKHTFQTRHESWGATDKTDLQHWARFSAWRPLAQQAKKSDFHCRNFAQRENIFMRWKEYFLVPDHRVRTINGASFEGFYYICFNQILGTVSGIYFHARSENRYQQLELKRVEDYGCMGAMEFR